MDSEKKVGLNGDQLNQYNEECNLCGRPTVPFMGRTRICPSCEAEPKEEEDTIEIDPFGFVMREPTEDEKKKLAPKKKIKLDLDILDLDFDLDLDSLGPGSNKP